MHTALIIIKSPSPFIFLFDQTNQLLLLHQGQIDWQLYNTSYITFSNPSVGDLVVAALKGIFLTVSCCKFPFFYSYFDYSYLMRRIY
jgi:hypothetical protein